MRLDEIDVMSKMGILRSQHQQRFLSDLRGTSNPVAKLPIYLGRPKTQAAVYVSAAGARYGSIQPRCSPAGRLPQILYPTVCVDRRGASGILTPS
jgi:hypothetical protein